MNFEELLETRDKRKTTKVRMPYGFYYKRLIDGKYSNFVEFHDEVSDHVTFSNCVRTEAEAVNKITDRHQLHFTPNEGDGGVYAIAIEVGNFMTIGDLLNENPAIVARKDFVNQTISDLVTLTSLLNGSGIFHLCFAPNNVLVRKSDATVRLLCHGSFYRRIDQDVLWEGVETYVAPEVLAGAPGDARSDVYALAKFIAWLYQSSGLPLELKSVIAKATAENPEARYGSVDELWKVLQNRQSARRTAVTGIAAIVIALAIVGGYFYMLPSPDDVEFVKPVTEPIPDDMLSEDGELLYDIGVDADSAAIAEAVARRDHFNDSIGAGGRRMKEYEAKAEQIFRKRFTKAADEILSKIYNNDKMNLTEKDFLVRSKAMTEELAKKEAELAKEANLGNERSQHIASEIIDQITNKKMKELDKDYMGLNPKAEEEKPASATSATTDKKEKK